MRTKSLLALLVLASASTIAAEIPPSITTPDKVETRLGTLDFKDGAPSKETLDKVYDNLDFTHAFEAFVNTFQGVNAAAIRKGCLDIGIKINRLTLVSVIFLPITFVTGFFGMNFNWMIANIGDRHAFLALGVALPVIIVALTVVLFRWRGLLPGRRRRATD